MLKTAFKKLKLIAPLVLILIVIFGTIYLVAQQSYRQNANDPQIQISEDQVRQLEAGEKIEAINNIPKVDLSQSLDTFIIIYDSQGNPLSSSGILNGRIPVPPPGVFQTVDNKGEDRVTWQPAVGVRIAAVVNAFHGPTSGYILAGRSLHEVENRENQLNMQVGAGFGVSLIILATALFLFL